jgi:hypothetical protein
MTDSEDEKIAEISLMILFKNILIIYSNCNITNICVQFQERTQIYLYFQLKFGYH